MCIHACVCETDCSYMNFPVDVFSGLTLTILMLTTFSPLINNLCAVQPGLSPFLIPLIKYSLIYSYVRQYGNLSLMCSAGRRHVTLELTRENARLCDWQRQNLRAYCPINRTCRNVEAAPCTLLTRNSVTLEFVRMS